MKPAPKKRKVIFSGNHLYDMMNFRGFVIRQLQKEGYQVVVIAPKQGERRRDTDAVIGAERSVLGDHPSVLDDIVDRVLREVVLNAGILLADHVLMALEDNRRNVFLAGSGFLGDEDVAGGVGLAGKAVRSGK